MRTSQLKKVHRDILLEYTWDDNNVITENFSVLNDLRTSQYSYIGGNLTSNGISNQLFPLDIVQNKWTNINLQNYNFLQLSSYPGGPLKHDSITLHFPNNWNFSEYSGVMLKVYTFDFTNTKLINLSNFYFNRFDTSQEDLLGDITPPFLYENRLWNKRIYLDIPSLNAVSLQRSSGITIPGSVNDLISNGVGLSITSPIFIDFHFIVNINTIGSTTQFILNNPFTVQFEQSPQLQELQVYIEESNDGDYFQISPIYNNSFDDFLDWIESSKRLGFKYFIEILITTFEENVKGKTYRFLIEDDFSEKVEFRPIIKSSSTSAIIDIEMRLIDKVTNSVLTRKSIYGLKPDQTSKYSLNPKRIMVKDVEKPKIYVKKKIELAQIDAVTRREVQKVNIRIDVPTLYDMNKIHAFSSSDVNPKSDNTLDNFHPLGIMKIVINPFDNIIKFTLALKDVDKLEYIDLTDSQEIKLNFKSSMMNLEFGLYEGSDLKNGTIIFKVNGAKYGDIKKMWQLNENLFYITTNNNNVRTVLYSGMFTIGEDINIMNIETETTTNTGDIILQDDENRGTAVITRRRIKV